MKRRFLVTIEIKTQPSKHRIIAYIKEAVKTWGGCYHPDDQLFSANIGRVVVKDFDKIENKQALALEHFLNQ